MKWEYQIPNHYPFEKRNQSGIKPGKELMKDTGFTKKELRYWYNGFMEDCPNGKLTEADFIQVYQDFCPTKGNPAKFAKEMFRMFDSGGDGTLEFEEFIKAMKMITTSDSDKKLQWVFKLYDLDGDNVVTQEEMIKIMGAIDEMLGISTLDGHKSAEERTRALFAEIDIDNDGTLNENEFISAAKKDPTILEFLRLFDHS